MIVWAARVLLRIGVALLLLCVVLRPAITTPEARMGSNLAIIACLLLVVTGLLVVSHDRRRNGHRSDR